MNLPESGSVSILRSKGRVEPILLGPIERAYLNQCDIPSSELFRTSGAVVSVATVKFQHGLLIPLLPQLHLPVLKIKKIREG
jgi:hypothetical protein